MARDGKDNFYRTLDLDEDTRKLIKWFRDIKQKMLNDEECNPEELTNDT